jgi:hypothetical protein
VTKLRRIKRAGHVARTEEKRNTYWDLMVKPEGKRLLRKPRKKCEINMKIALTEIV